MIEKSLSVCDLNVILILKRFRGASRGIFGRVSLETFSKGGQLKKNTLYQLAEKQKHML